MTTSTTAIWIICAVVVVALAICLIGVAVAARKPHQEHAHGERLRGSVQGGVHVGGGRSVAPRRDEPVVPDDAPAGDTLHPDVETHGTGSDSAHARQGSGSPLDL